MKKINALTVCCGYSDFLCWSILENKQLFDSWIIVTDTKDKKTKELCDNYNLHCIQTDVFYENGIFNKYAGINEGLKYIDKDSWIIFLDADIILHNLTKYVLEHIPLDETCIYGIDRVNCVGLPNWLKYISKRDSLFQNWLLHSAGFEFGSRLVHYFGENQDNGKFVGWRPLGFFQMCYGKAFNTYPQNTIGADHCDLEFVRNWGRSRRILIPELIGIHLESEGTFKGINWYGRKSLPFEINQDTSFLNKIRNKWLKIKIKWQRKKYRNKI